MLRNVISLRAYVAVVTVSLCTVYSADAVRGEQHGAMQPQSTSVYIDQGVRYTRSRGERFVAAKPYITHSQQTWTEGVGCTRESSTPCVQTCDASSAVVGEKGVHNLNIHEFVQLSRPIQHTIFSYLMQEKEQLRAANQ